MTSTFPALTTDIALRLVTTGLAAARASGLSVAIVVVDSGGHALAAARAESSGFVHANVAHRKAVLSANFSAPSHALLDMLKGDPVALAAVMHEPTLCLLPGGFPIMI